MTSTTDLAALVAPPPNGLGWSDALRRFADGVGPSGPVRVVGGRTHHDVQLHWQRWRIGSVSLRTLSDSVRAAAGRHLRR